MEETITICYTNDRTYVNCFTDIFAKDLDAWKASHPDCTIKYIFDTKSRIYEST